MIMPSFESREALIRHLNDRQINSVFHYLPLHTSDMGLGFGAKVGDCPVTEAVSQRLVRLPFHLKLTAEDRGQVVDGVTSFNCSAFLR
jgi:dTDP-4-amino-4,6-dideoxygalactose transaminase